MAYALTFLNLALYEEDMTQEEFVCKRHTSVPLITPLSEAIPQTVTAIWLVTANGDTAIFVRDSVYIPVWFRGKPPYKLLHYIYSWRPSSLESAASRSYYTAGRHHLRVTSNEGESGRVI
jgi:hypothetical protein